MAGENVSLKKHDWQSQAYVNEWIRQDIQKDEQRRPQIRKMLAAASIPSSSIDVVLDVGGGFGVVTEELLGIFPLAKVTLQDFSQAMLGHARSRLSGYADQVKYVLADLREPSWVDEVGGPFDLIVSGWAIHNLADPRAIGNCYRAISGLLKPDSLFLDYDLFDHSGGVGLHATLLRDAGFVHVDCIWHETPSAVIAARV